MYINKRCKCTVICKFGMYMLYQYKICYVAVLVYHFQMNLYQKIRTLRIIVFFCFHNIIYLATPRFTSAVVCIACCIHCTLYTIIHIAYIYCIRVLLIEKAIKHSSKWKWGVFTTTLLPLCFIEEMLMKFHFTKSILVIHSSVFLFKITKLRKLLQNRMNYNQSIFLFTFSLDQYEYFHQNKKTKNLKGQRC